jgi:hypothetical protein
MFVVCSLVHTITSRRYHRSRAIRLNNVDKIVRVVPFVSNYIRAVISDYQRFSLNYVVSLTGRQKESERIPQCVNCEVYFCAKATSRAT